MPVGLPASGKSTFFKELQKQVDIEILSFDSITEDFQKAHNLSYDEAYYTMPLEVKTERFEARRDTLIAQSRNIFPDLTNLSGVTRGEVLNYSPSIIRSVSISPSAKKPLWNDVKSEKPKPANISPKRSFIEWPRA